MSSPEPVLLQVQFNEFEFTIYILHVLLLSSSWKKVRVAKQFCGAFICT